MSGWRLLSHILNMTLIDEWVMFVITLYISDDTLLRGDTFYICRQMGQNDNIICLFKKITHIKIKKSPPTLSETRGSMVDWGLKKYILPIHQKSNVLPKSFHPITLHIWADTLHIHLSWYFTCTFELILYMYNLSWYFTCTFELIS